jgi:pimeloyl-ACP methyl ester carboxylesterase
MIHGNSGSSRSFERQKYLKNCVFIDLPGHGLSCPPSTDDNVVKKIYSFVGYADVIYAFIKKYVSDSKIIIAGWSLGGQIAYALMAKYPNAIHGVVSWGAPPVPPDNLMIGFKPFPEAPMMGQRDMFTREQAMLFNEKAGLPDEDQFIEDCMICDGRSRSMMIAAANDGSGVDARTLMANTNIPIIILMGGQDLGVNNEYSMNQVTYSSLIYMTIVPKANHALHYSHPFVIEHALDTLHRLL